MKYFGLIFWSLCLAAFAILNIFMAKNNVFAFGVILVSIAFVLICFAIYASIDDAVWYKKYKALKSPIGKRLKEFLVSHKFKIIDYEHTKRIIQQKYPFIEVSYEQFRALLRKSPENISFWTVKDSKNKILAKSLLRENLKRLNPKNLYKENPNTADNMASIAVDKGWLPEGVNGIYASSVSLNLFAVYNAHNLDESVETIPEDAVFILLNSSEDAMKATMEVILYAESVSRKAYKNAA